MSVFVRHNVLRPPWSLQSAMLAAGIAGPVLWLFSNEVVAPSLYPGYSRVSRPISELTATYAPSRATLIPVIVVYEALIIMFGTGVWRAGRGKRALRITGGLLVGAGLLGLAALPFPLTQPPNAGLVNANLPFSDAMHAILSGGATTLLMFITYGFGAAALGRGFRIYSIASAAAEVAGGALMFTFDARGLGDLPSHWVGGAERALTWVWMLWVVVLAVLLLRIRTKHPSGKSASQ